MSPARKPAKKPATESEARRTNVLLEEIRSSLSTVAEGVQLLRTKVDPIERKFPAALEELDLIKSVVRHNADEIDRIKSDLSTLKAFAVDHSRKFDALETQAKMLRDDLKTFTQRLESVEARLAT